MEWLRLPGSLKLYVSFAKEPYKRDYILQKRPIIVRSLLIVVTPYLVTVHRSDNTFWQDILQYQYILDIAIYLLTAHRSFFLFTSLSSDLLRCEEEKCITTDKLLCSNIYYIISCYAVTFFPSIKDIFVEKIYFSQKHVGKIYFSQKYVGKMKKFPRNMWEKWRADVLTLVTMWEAKKKKWQWNQCKLNGKESKKCGEEEEQRALLWTFRSLLWKGKKTIGLKSYAQLMLYHALCLLRARALSLSLSHTHASGYTSKSLGVQMEGGVGGQ